MPLGRPLGRIRKVALREVWKHEAIDFTPWLAEPENLTLLGETLGLGPLSRVATEVEVGRFSADIVARDDEDGVVLVENQLDATDHRHLGQIMTYLAGQPVAPSVTIVWIAEQILEEHRAAVDWLNSNTSEQFGFFAVVVELFQIGDSPPAPRFDVVAKPNAWTRDARQAAVGAQGRWPSLYVEYWTEFLEAYGKAVKRLPAARVSRRHAFLVEGARGGSRFNVVVVGTEGSLRAELLIRSADPRKLLFNALLAERDAIEREFGTPLAWDELPSRDRSRISIQRSGIDVSARDAWPAQHAWLIEQVQQLQRVLADRVARAVSRLGEVEPQPSGDE